MNHVTGHAATPSRWWAWLLLSVTVVAIDQLTKAAVVANFRLGEVRSVTSFFSIVLALNAGAAFSFLSDAAGWQRYLFGGIAVVAATFLIWMLRRGGNRVYCAGLSLILGGAIGNLWDRAAHGKVVDFLLFHDYLPFRGGLVAWMDPFPAFNIADSAITVGAIMLILDSFLQQREARRDTMRSS